MSQFIGGVMVGALLTGSLGLAANFYDNNGKPSSPYGSVQSYDYFRQRQLYLDTNAMRNVLEDQRLKQQNRQLNPCVR